MFVKQIDMAKALELAAKGMEIKVPVSYTHLDVYKRQAPSRSF